MRKYILTEETISLDGHTLHRILAIRDIIRPIGKIGLVVAKAGDKGGFVETEENLSHEGCCWIKGEAKVYENAKISDNALISDYAKIFGDAQIFGNIKVCGNAKICKNAIKSTKTTEREL